MPSCGARLLVFGFLLVTACQRAPAPAPPPSAPAAPTPSVPAAPPPPEPSQAALRSLSDAFVRDWIAGAHHAAYLKMERRYRASSSEAQLGQIMDGLNRTFGQLLEAEYDSAEVGTNLSFAGFRKIWSFIYNVRTSTKPKGYQAKVTLTADPDLGVSGFTIVVFLMGSPGAK